jgi:hypothetical protein
MPGRVWPWYARWSALGLVEDEVGDFEAAGRGFAGEADGERSAGGDRGAHVQVPSCWAVAKIMLAVVTPARVIFLVAAPAARVTTPPGEKTALPRTSRALPLVLRAITPVPLVVSPNTPTPLALASACTPGLVPLWSPSTPMPSAKSEVPSLLVAGISWW